MGDETEKEKRIKQFKDTPLIQHLCAKQNQMQSFSHCLPAYYGYEVTKDVAYGSQSVIFDEAGKQDVGADWDYG